MTALNPDDRESWFDSAVCNGLTAMFYPKGSKGWRGDAALIRINEAKAICDTCPVKAECGEYSMTKVPSHDEGIYGGMTRGERRSKRRRERAPKLLSTSKHGSDEALKAGCNCADCQQLRPELDCLIKRADLASRLGMTRRNMHAHAQRDGFPQAVKRTRDGYVYRFGDVRDWYIARGWWDFAQQMPAVPRERVAS